jgi:hypothetical protein
VAITTFTPASCSPGMGDGTGTMGLQSLGSPHGLTLHIVDGQTGNQRAVTSNYDRMDGSFTPQLDGFLGILRAPGANTFSAQYWDHRGNFVASGQTMQGGAAFASGISSIGLLLAGDFSWSSLPARHQAWMIDDLGMIHWAHDLASKGTVFGLGLDAQDRAIVITDGGPGTITAQWFDGQGSALTGEFVILTNFGAGPNTWFETGPLIGGGVAVKRVDQQTDADGRPFRTAQWLVTVAAGQNTAQVAPQWLTSRASTTLSLARGGKAYALLPLGAPGADCNQRIEVLAPDGTSCGFFDAGIARGQCRTEDLALGLDGTPVQLLPRSLAPASTCSYRWWPAALH